MNVSLFPGYRFPTQLTVHGLGVFAVSNSDIVHLWSLYPSGTPQLLLADATAAKVGLVSVTIHIYTACGLSDQL